MKVVEQSVTIEGVINGEEILRTIESAARCCYLSSHRIGGFETCKRFVAGLIKSGHTSTLEHVSFRARVITNRGVSHEWVRHRVGCSYSQESTRYCTYGDKAGGITVIWPWYLGEKDRISYDKDGTITDDKIRFWVEAIGLAEAGYLALLAKGCSPQEARGVLPNDLKTEFVTTMTAVAWRHFFTLRCAPAAHPQIAFLAKSALTQLHGMIPVLFDDLAETFLTSDKA